MGHRRAGEAGGITNQASAGWRAAEHITSQASERPNKIRKFAGKSFLILGFLQDGSR